MNLKQINRMNWFVLPVLILGIKIGAYFLSDGEYSLGRMITDTILVLLGYCTGIFFAELILHYVVKRRRRENDKE